MELLPLLLPHGTKLLCHYIENLILADKNQVSNHITLTSLRMLILSEERYIILCIVFIDTNKQYHNSTCYVALIISPNKHYNYINHVHK